jgi:hypothetical protein
MIEIKNKYIIGTHIMFYEIEMVGEHVQSIINAVKEVKNQENISVDLFFNISEYFEKIDRTKISKDELISRFKELVKQLETEIKSNVSYKVYEDNEPLTMVDYRRDLNYNGCKNNDYVIWGESDALLPKEMFHALESIKDYANKQNIHRFVTTFGVRKMWDEHWKPLEHIDMTDKPLHQKFLPDGSKNPEAYNQPYSIRYTMNIDEMNEINSKYDSFDIRVMNHPHFDGSGLVLSSDLIKTGVNIPQSIIGHAVDDTAMMTMCKLLMGSQYVQFIVKNILKVHNREHPKKRNYCLQMEGDRICTQEKGPNQRGSWYENLKQMANINLSNCGDKQTKFYDYEDFKKVMEKE